MVDTIQCQSELDLTELFYEKLLLGAIDKRLDRKKIEAHDPAKHGQDAYHEIPHRTKAPGTDRERPWSEAETLVGSSRRGNSLHANRSSTMRTPIESPVEAAQSAQPFERNPSNMTHSAQASSASAAFQTPRRHPTFSSTIQEAEEPEPRTPQRSSTAGIHQSHWWNPRRNVS